MKKILIILGMTAALSAEVHYDKRPCEKQEDVVKYDKRTYEKQESVVVYDNNDKKVIPSEITRNSANAIELDFSGMTPLTGTYKVRVNK